jgi:nucleotide-binding universal stress UspA family protein
MLATKNSDGFDAQPHDRSGLMAPHAIVSYDDTPNDHDALMLGRVLGEAGARLTLAYVRHTTQAQRSREELEEHEAEALLERGARWLGDDEVERRVVVSASTGEGLAWLAEQEAADIIVFGSDYRTAAGHVALGRSVSMLLEGGRAALAIAPANYRSNRTPEINSVGVLSAPGNEDAVETARGLAERFGAALAQDQRRVDLLVVGSRPEAPEGRVMISSQAQNTIEAASSPVLVLARGLPLHFELPIAVY